MFRALRLVGTSAAGVFANRVVYQIDGHRKRQWLRDNVFLVRSWSVVTQPNPQSRVHRHRAMRKMNARSLSGDSAEWPIQAGLVSHEKAATLLDRRIRPLFVSNDRPPARAAPAVQRRFYEASLPRPRVLEARSRGKPASALVRPGYRHLEKIMRPEARCEALFHHGL